MRKTADGLSPNAMARCTTMVALLGDGDPLVAFTRLQARILETLELGDDTTGLDAAAYSLGLASDRKTHLDRLVAFGEEYGYEARQARRHSDKGIEQLATLICSNWVVHTVPTVEIYLAQQTDGSFALTVRTKRQRFVDMQPIRIHRTTKDGHLATLTPQPIFVPAPAHNSQTSTGANDGDYGEGREDTSESLWITEQLQRPLHLPAPTTETPNTIVRIDWHGEMWPRFTTSTIAPIREGVLVTSQTLGNTVQITVQQT